MMYDFALDTKTGDWIFGANGDIQGVEGETVIEQRVWTRLHIRQGWELDPTNGQLGSRLSLGLHAIPRGRALIELPLMVKEALAPMDDISVSDVWTEESETDVNAIVIHIRYTVIDVDRDDLIQQESQESLTIELEA